MKLKKFVKRQGSTDLGQIFDSGWSGYHIHLSRSVNPYLKAEVELKDTEEKYKYISHEVDLLIYSIEPIVAYLGVGEFNEILCGAGRVYLLDHLEFRNIW